MNILGFQIIWNQFSLGKQKFDTRLKKLHKNDKAVFYIGVKGSLQLENQNSIVI
jgi:hypothetical protein